jgi:hypothetical protein
MRGALGRCVAGGLLVKIGGSWRVETNLRILYVSCGLRSVVSTHPTKTFGVFLETTSGLFGVCPFFIWSTHVVYVHNFLPKVP